MELLKSINHPEELCALIKYKLSGGGQKQTQVPRSQTSSRCYEYLSLTSRSFAAVIQALDPELRDAVCIFYLVLRALDTVEDDPTIPAEEKTTLLRCFHTFLLDPDWHYTRSSEKDRIVLQDFPTISAEFRALRVEFREVISDICRQMGSGMIVYYLKSPDSIEQWNEYCHYVAGLVGIGLSNLFSASLLESADIGSRTSLSNSMGLFLQKTNIIRDYLEDVMQNRFFWPSQVWRKFAKELPDLAKAENRRQAVSCLNELIVNALSHVPDVLSYLSFIKNQSVFNFCAIPQVMAVATLERCYNNPRVFTGVVKIRKGEAVRLMSFATNMESVKAIFSHFVSKIEGRIPKSDPSCVTSHQCVAMALSVSKTSHEYIQRSLYMPVYLSCAMLIIAIVWQYWTSVVHILTSMTE